MKLIDCITNETDVYKDNVMFLRHATKDLDVLGYDNETIDRYTLMQPNNGKYDLRPTLPKYIDISILVAVIKGYVHTVYKIIDIEKEGTNYTLMLKKFVDYDKSINRKELPARIYKAKKLINLSCIGKKTYDWKPEICCVVRSGNKLMDKIKI